LRQHRTELVVTAKRRERSLHAVAKPGGGPDRRVMIRGDVDVRTAQVPGECTLKPWRHSPVIGEHDDRARYRRRRCVAHIESRQLPCGAPQLERSDVGSAGVAHDLTAAYTCGMSE
jgi:hypothetical protein